MIKTNEILYNNKYKEYLKELNEYEKDRIYCKHNLEHFLNMSRIAYIKVLEEGLAIEKDIIFSIGLLHDIGRVLQYRNGTPHDEGSIIIAEEIFNEVKFTEDEKKIILSAIKNHRKEGIDKIQSIIYKSDKESRECFLCEARESCYWDESKKNLKIKN